MDRPIQVGDLVQVVKSCCDRHTRSPVFVVSKIFPAGDEECLFCDHKFKRVIEAGDEEGWSYPLEWLKRIPPLEELEGVEREAKVPA